MARLRLPSTVVARCVEQAVQTAKQQGFNHLVATVPAERLDQANALIHAKFRLVDVGVTFRSKVAPDAANAGATASSGSGPESEHKVPRIRLATPADRNSIVESCGRIFRSSRYYADPFFSRADADELHRRWIGNLFEHRAQAIFVAEVDADPVGFSALRLFPEEQLASVELIGVAPAAAGKGLGKMLLERSFAWLPGKATALNIKTQAGNRAACGLYQRFGLTLHRLELSFALRVEQP